MIKRFVMTNPMEQTPGKYSCWLTLASELWRILPRIEAHDAVHDIVKPDGWKDAEVWLSPLWDYETAWLTLYDFIESEIEEVDLDPIWTDNGTSPAR